jgi:hypothetical protein
MQSKTMTRYGFVTYVLALSLAAIASQSAKESWVWIYRDWETSLSTLTLNARSFTHVSPLFYSLNYNYNSGAAYYQDCNGINKNIACVNSGTNNFGGLTTKQFTQQITNVNLVTVPGIYAGAINSGGVDIGVQNILDNVSNAATNFISAMVQEAKNNGYAGYNLDWEMGPSIDSTYADKFVNFVDAFKTALGSGMSLSVDVIAENIVGTTCSAGNGDGYLDLVKLSSSSIDRIIIEDYTTYLGTPSTSCKTAVLSTTNRAPCPCNDTQPSCPDVTVIGLFNFMCTNVPEIKTVIGLEAYSSATNPIADRVISAMKSYGFTKIAIWPQQEDNYPFISSRSIASQSDWYSVLAQFLGTEGRNFSSSPSTGSSNIAPAPSPSRSDNKRLAPTLIYCTISVCVLSLFLL